jgi:hypothetical protein
MEIGASLACSVRVLYAERSDHIADSVAVAQLSARSPA